MDLETRNLALRFWNPWVDGTLIQFWRSFHCSWSWAKVSLHSKYSNGQVETGLCHQNWKDIRIPRSRCQAGYVVRSRFRDQELGMELSKVSVPTTMGISTSDFKEFIELHLSSEKNWREKCYTISRDFWGQTFLGSRDQPRSLSEVSVPTTMGMLTSDFKGFIELRLSSEKNWREKCDTF